MEKALSAPPAHQGFSAAEPFGQGRHSRAARTGESVRLSASAATTTAGIVLKVQVQRARISPKAPGTNRSLKSGEISP